MHPPGKLLSLGLSLGFLLIGVSLLMLPLSLHVAAQSAAAPSIEPFEPRGPLLAVELSSPALSGTALAGLQRQTSTLLPSPSLPLTPTPTPGPICVAGWEPQQEPGKDRQTTRLLLPDVPEAHGICSRGDEDWFRFAGVVGQRYQIDIPRMDVGLDLVLAVYDPDGQMVAVNDDFSYCTPTSIQSTDLAPRIPAFEPARDGTYIVPRNH